MKYARWAVYAFLSASILFSARELLTVAAAAKKIAADKTDPAAPAEAPPAPRPLPAPVGHAEAADTNSGTGKVFAARGGPQRAALRGGGVIIDADGTRLELAPPDRPKPPVPSGVVLAVKAVQKAGAGAALPALDDPSADLATRKRRAEIMLGACAVGAFALVLWARRWRPA